MKVLVLGGGGREHALVWALGRSAAVTEIVCAPGNGGIAALARCLPVDTASVEAVQALVRQEQPHLVVIGPEAPLAAGVTDALQAQGVRVFGPTREAARLESSKAFAKDFMQRWAIPTAAHAFCRTQADVAAALTGFFPAEDGVIGSVIGGVVVKADGLFGGKGVVLCHHVEEAADVAAQMFSGELLGAKADGLVLEELMTGPEVSYFAICDGRHAATLAVAQDHKRIGEGDTGPNTGGMGAYSTDTLVSAETLAWMRTEVAQRVVDGMAAEGTPFAGVLFVGFMLTPAGPRVLEFNTRFGDPETEAILLRLETPLLDILNAAVDGRVGELDIRLKPGAAVCVVAASAGYPGAYQTGKVIDGLRTSPAGIEVFHAGTKLMPDGAVVTAGGRVLAVTAAADDLAAALDQIYATLDRITFDGMQFRRDIGWRALSAR
jgi:phosphoribosylamine--glycine ligase